MCKRKMLLEGNKSSGSELFMGGGVTEDFNFNFNYFCTIFSTVKITYIIKKLMVNVNKIIKIQISQDGCNTLKN